MVTVRLASDIFEEKVFISIFKFSSSTIRSDRVFSASSCIWFSLLVSFSNWVIWFTILVKAILAEVCSSSNLILAIFNVCKIAAFSASILRNIGMSLRIFNFDTVFFDTSIWALFTLSVIVFNSFFSLLYSVFALNNNVENNVTSAFLNLSPIDLYLAAFLPCFSNSTSCSL